MNDLISEFFIDIITRVIPGFIVLALYPTILFTSVFNKISASPALSIPCLIGEAWVIGFTIERATYVPFAFVISFYKHFKSEENQKRSFENLIGSIFGDNMKGKAIGLFEYLIEDHKSGVCFETDNNALKNNFEWFKFNRRHEQKLVGERIFCRVMFVISLVTYFISLGVCIWNPNSTFFGDSKCPLIYFAFSLLGTLIFGAAWAWDVWSRYVRNGNTVSDSKPEK